LIVYLVIWWVLLKTPPVSETEFFVKVADAQVTFVHDQDGRVTHLLLRLSGNERKAKKID